MPWGLNVRFVVLGVCAALIFVSGWTINGWRLGNKIQSIKAEFALRESEAQAEARRKEKVLVEKAEDTRRKKDAEIKAINARLSSVLVELRQRPSRSGSGTDTATCQGGTGASLYAEDGEFLIGEAARADKLREALNECYERYEALRKELNK